MEQAFQEMQRQIQELTATLQQQQEMQQQIRQQLRGTSLPPNSEPVPLSQPQTTSATAPSRPRFSEPELFDGQRDRYESWKTKAIVYVGAHPDIYPTERDRVLYILQRLTGRAYDQMIPLMLTVGTSQEAPEIGSMQLAMGRLDALFGQVNRIEDAAAKLNNLRQRSSERVAEYTAEFQRLLGIVGTGEAEAALCVRYKNGLRYEISDRLVGLGLMNNLQELVNRAITIDQDLENDRTRKGGIWRRTMLNQQGPPMPHAPSNPTPMDIGRLQSEPSGRGRGRRPGPVGPCYNCGGPNHFARHCQAERQSATSRAAVANASPVAPPASTEIAEPKEKAQSDF
jgi:retrotransposon gag protein/zinc knuckle protein